jgi:DNA-directed RNA polymerase alpha subunit
MDFDRKAKFCDVFENLQGVDLDIVDLDLSVRSYNNLKRIGVDNLQQLLQLSVYYFTDILKRAPSDIVEKLQELSEKTT